MEILKAIYDLIINPFILIYINLLMLCRSLLSSIDIPQAFGFAIILSTIVIKLVTYPLNSKQLKASQKMQQLSPLISKIKSDFKGDNRRIMEEQQKLFREQGVSQLAGCLPSLVQLPIFFALYNVLTNVVKQGGAEQVKYINSMVWEPLKLQSPIELSFFGIPLGHTPGQLFGQLGLAIVLIPLVTAALTFLQSKMMFPKPVKPYPSDSPKEKSEKKENVEMSQVMQSQMTYMMPLFVGFISFTFPIGISLYWNTFTIFGIIQQYKIMGLGGLAPLWQRIKR